MLTLSRKRGEVIFIGEDIIVQVIDIRGSFVRLGITAPKEVKIYREELFKLNEENKEDQANT